MVEPLVHEMEGGGREEERRSVCHSEAQRELVATGVGHRHLEPWVQLDNCFRGLGGGGGVGGIIV